MQFQQRSYIGKNDMLIIILCPKCVEYVKISWDDMNPLKVELRRFYCLSFEFVQSFCLSAKHDSTLRLSCDKVSGITDETKKT